MDFYLLGSVEFTVGGHGVKLGRRQERQLICLLLLEPRRAVPVDRLVDLLWRDDPPASGRATVQTYVARLRRELAPYGVELATRGDGYAVEVDPHAVDVHRFTAGLERSRQLTDPLQRVTVLDEALALWRGPLMSGVADDQLRERVGAGLAESRLAALELRAAALLEGGLHGQAADALTELVTLHPMREHPVELLMLSLYRAGRQADALSAYRCLRRTLVDELGVEPSTNLRTLHRRMLDNDPQLDQAKAKPAAPRRQLLPWDVPDFVGRSAELSWLDGFSRERATAGTVLIGALAGIGGVGKTALAVRWAHQVADRYPDGQLYVNLRGFDQQQPMSPIAALGQLLRLLGVPQQQIPGDLAEAAALYRSTLAGMNVLILLDNAGSAEQVRPLLPAGKGNLVLVTSRDRLSGLVARDGARRLDIDILSPDEALLLLQQIMGAERVAAEPAATAALATAAGHLPLALRIAATNLAENPRQTISAYVAELAARRSIADFRVEGDPQSTVQAIFDQSYLTLPAGPQQLFRLLGLVAGPDVTAPAAAALADVPEDVSSVWLAHLAGVHLLTEHRPGRYEMHDLVRLYAQEQVAETDRPAAGRLLSWYLAAADAADQVLRPYRVIPFALPQTQQPHADDTAALEWADAEAANLLAAIAAAEQTDPRLCWQLATVMYSWLERRRRREEWLEAYTVGLRAAPADGDRIGQAIMHQALGVCLFYLNRLEAATDTFEQVVTLRREIGDPKPLAVSLAHVGNLYAETGQDERAVGYLTEALAMLEALPDTDALQGVNLNNLGWAHHRAGRDREAIGCYQRAIAIARDTNNAQSLSFAEGNLGLSYAGLGDHENAWVHWTEAAKAGELAGDRRLAANSYDNIGQAEAHLGRIAQARVNLRKAHEMYTEMDDPDADAVLALLATLDE